MEVGVWRGTHAEQLLRRYQVRLLFLVDPYKPYHETVISEFVKEAYDYASHRLWSKGFSGRYHFLLETSVRAAQRFEEESLDFVYIDGDHSKEAVIADLQTWWPKIKAGGYMGLDDYNSKKHPVVTEAVESFGKPVIVFGNTAVLKK